MSLAPDILEYFDAEVRKRKGILASAYRREFDGNLRRTIGPCDLAAHNWIDYYALNVEEIADTIERQIGHFKSIGHSFRWKVYSHDRPPELCDALLERGFKTWEPCTLMILDVESFQVAMPEEFEYRRVSDPDELPNEWQRIKEEVWDEGADEFISALRSELRDMGDHMRVFVAKRGESTVGCGLIRYSERKTFGGLFAGATVPAERGQGVYRGMIAARVEDARSADAKYLYAEAGAMSRPILERLGFAAVATITNFVFDAS